MPELGRLVPPYGGIERCANADCRNPSLGEETGAFMFRDLVAGKLVVFCGDCAYYAELNARDQFLLVAL